MTVGRLIGRSSCVGAQRSGLARSAAHAPDERPVPAPPAEPPALQGDGPEGVPGIEPPAPLRPAALLPARAVRSAWPGARLAARLWSWAAALGPIRLGEVHRGAVEAVDPSAGSAVSAASWVREAVGAEGVAATLARDAPATEAALDATVSWATHSPVPAGPLTGATVPTCGAVSEGTIEPTTGASGAAIGAMT